MVCPPPRESTIDRLGNDLQVAIIDKLIAWTHTGNLAALVA